MPSARGDLSPASSFLAGVVTASVLWGIISLAMAASPRRVASPSGNGSRGASNQSCSEPSPSATAAGEDNEEDGSEQRARSNTYSNRIGELPSISQQPRPIPWPWMNSVRQGSVHAAANLIDKLSSFSLAANDEVGVGSDAEDQTDGVAEERYREEETNDIGNGDDGTEDIPGMSPEDAKGLCIGSIFGLDVGGTLAKLVYFEQRADEYEHDHNRKEHYHQAAMARAVLEARRSSSNKSSHSHQSEMDLERMWQLRQASVPDQLAAFGEEAGLSVDSTDARSIALSRRPQDQTGDTSDFSPAVEAIAPDGDLQRRNLLSKSFSTLTSMKKSRSMLDMSVEKAEALDRFYNFARRLDTYEAGVKDKQLSFYSRYLAGELHFIRFETCRMKNAMDLIRVNNLHLNIAEMGATGGGAHKYEGDWKRLLGIQMDKKDELDSLVAGLQFILADVVGECYTFQPKRRLEGMSRSHHSSGGDSRASEGSPSESDEAYDSDYCIGNVKPDTEQQNINGKKDSNERKEGADVDEWWWSRKVQRDVVIDSETYPYLIVTIGTGVSILRVDGPRKHERISGSTIGGGTYWGLCRLLTNVESFEDVMKLAEDGDPSKVDLMIGDIYGKGSDALEKLGLSANLVASSFGKLIAKQNPAEGLQQEDLARALLLLVTNNIGQVAYLNAQIHKTKRIYFVGNFLRQNVISQQRLSFAINFWSAGKNEALFLEHEGYFGALGAFLLSQGIPHPTSSDKDFGKRRSHTRSRTQTNKADLTPDLEMEQGLPFGRRRARTYSR